MEPVCFPNNAIFVYVIVGATIDSLWVIVRKLDLITQILGKKFDKMKSRMENIILIRVHG